MQHNVSYGSMDAVYQNSSGIQQWGGEINAHLMQMPQSMQAMAPSMQAMSSNIMGMPSNMQIPMVPQIPMQGLQAHMHSSQAICPPDMAPRSDNPLMPPAIPLDLNDITTKQALLPTPSLPSLERKSMDQNKSANNSHIIRKEEMGNKTSEIERNHNRSQSDRGSDRKRGASDIRGSRGDRSRDRKRGRSRSRDRENTSSSGGSRRRTKWDSTNTEPTVQPAGIVMSQQGAMMGYNNMSSNPNMMMNNPIGQMDMMNNAMGQMGMMMDPSMMMQGQMQNQIYGQMMMPNQPIVLKDGIIYPPVPGVMQPPRRDRPPGCRSLFIGGVPSHVKEETILEIFGTFGNIVDVRVHKKGFCHIRYETQSSIDAAFSMNGYRLKLHDMQDCDVTSLYVNYAINKEDQREHEAQSEVRGPPVQPCTPAALKEMADKIRDYENFLEAATAVAHWLEKGECNKKNSGVFYSTIQSANNHIREILTEKMNLDDEFSAFKEKIKEKYQLCIKKFEQVGRILAAASQQRVWDHLTKQQRKNIETWQRFTQDLENLREEFNQMFDEEYEGVETDGKLKETIEQLKQENTELTFELEGYKNEAHLAKDEAERKFEKFKAHFIAEQALSSGQPISNFGSLPQFPPLPETKPLPKPAEPLQSDEAKLISVLTAYLIIHPSGASLDELVTYAGKLGSTVSPSVAHGVLQKYNEVFKRSGPGHHNTWLYVPFFKTN